MKLKPPPGTRVVIARGPGAGLAGTVCAPRPCDRTDDTHVWVQFDREPGTRYPAPIAGLDPEAIPRKPPKPSVPLSQRQSGLAQQPARRRPRR